MTAGPLLEVSDLSVAFCRIDSRGRSTRIPALQGISLEIRLGEVVAVVGSSGAGKSVLAHAVLGLLPRNAAIDGWIRFRGEPLTQPLLQRVRGREIALVPQSVAFLDPLVKIKHAVRWAARRAGLRRTEARLAQERAFAAVGLANDEGERYPFELSGGMVRRVLLAMATIGSAPLLIADEPTPGLDSESVREALQLVRELANQGKAALVISHDIPACLTVADRVAVFREGRVVEVAPVGAFSGSGEKLHEEYSRALWNALPQNAFARPKGLSWREDDAHPSHSPEDEIGNRDPTLEGMEAYYSTGQ